MKIFIKTFAVASLLSTVAYADATFHPSTYTTYKKHKAHNGSVQVLSNLPSNELSYTEIGMVRIPTKDISSEQDALAELKKKAAKHGGTAVVLSDDAKAYSNGGSTKNFSAIALIRH